MLQGRSSFENRTHPSISGSVSGSISGATVDSQLKVFSGKKVLLVEVCDMVSLQACDCHLTQLRSHIFSCGRANDGGLDTALCSPSACFVTQI